MADEPQTPGRPGIGVDSRGGAVVDPTDAVRALNEAGIKAATESLQAAAHRQDDLRDASVALFNCRIDCIKEIMQVRGESTRQIAEIRDAHSKEMRISEAARLDSIRQVDVTAVSTEARRALEAIQTLATTSARDAETLRNLVNTTALTTAAQTADTVKQIVERIAALERSSYEGVGKQRIVDPQMIELLSEVKRLGEGRRESAGVGQGINTSWIVFVGAATLILMVVGIGGAFLVKPSPQVVYASPSIAGPAVKSP